MSADPYAHDEDDEVVVEKRLQDPRILGTPRRPRSDSDGKIGAGFRPVDRNLRPGAQFTTLNYDPRDPGSVGAPITRLSYDPHRVSGSTGIEEVPDWAMANRAAYDGNVMAWLPDWVKAKAAAGIYPPSWARDIFIRKGRPDLAQWCDMIHASLRKQGA